jgi:hypothetical protein
MHFLVFAALSGVPSRRCPRHPHGEGHRRLPGAGRGRALRPHGVGLGAVHSKPVRQGTDLGTRVQGVCGWTGRQGPHAPRPGSQREDRGSAGT